LYITESTLKYVVGGEGSWKPVLSNSDMKA